jgi:tRNA(fMet)-specific endonuclease VapC
MIHLFDTDTAILMMRGLSITEPRTEKQRQRREMGRRILAACRRHAAKGDVIGLSAITIAELEFGACGADDPDAERARMERVLAPFARFDFGADEPPRHYGEVRSKLEAEGQGIGPNDLLIAAHALALSATLVTNNVQEFKRVKGLMCVNWGL